MSTLFRQSALAQHTSPDQLDQRIQIISRGLLLAFAAMLLLVISGVLWSWFGTVTTTVAGSGLLTNNRTGVKLVATTHAGLVEQILLQAGDRVQPGEPLLHIRDGDATFEVTSLVDGRLADVRVAEGQFVAAGMPGATVSSAADDFVVLAFLPVASGEHIVPGMAVEVMPETVNQQEYGSMPGMVLSVSDGPVSQAVVQTLLQDNELAALVTGGRLPLLLYIDIFEDSNTPSGFRWHTGVGPSFALTDDTLASVEVIVAEQRPLALLLPRLFGQ